LFLLKTKAGELLKRIFFTTKTWVVKMLEFNDTFFIKAEKKLLPSHNEKITVHFLIKNA
jgi:hypothetical protein